MLLLFRYLNIWDIGGQKSLRSYWRNYYEQTDGMVWVVDCSDIRRLDDCRQELHGLLKEEVCFKLSVECLCYTASVLKFIFADTRFLHSMSFWVVR
jgi:GTPase SAR1 family protein